MIIHYVKSLQAQGKVNDLVGQQENKIYNLITKKYEEFAGLWVTS